MGQWGKLYTEDKLKETKALEKRKEMKMCRDSMMSMEDKCNVMSCKFMFVKKYKQI